MTLEDEILEGKWTANFAFARTPPAAIEKSAGLWHEKFGTPFAREERGRPKLGPNSIEWARQFDQKDGKAVGDQHQIEEYAVRMRDLVRVRGGFVFDASVRDVSAFVTGVGIAHATEVGFAWHRTLGTPYLPGSGVKGLALTYGRDWDDSGIPPKERASELRRMFGTAAGGAGKGQGDDDSLDESAGTVIFLDAVPVGCPVLAAQVMTPHGSGSGEPEFAGQPTPVGFLAVKGGSTFRFGLIPKRFERRPDRIAIEDCRRAKGWLQEALKVMGAGAKTKSGYGRFDRFVDC